MALNTFLPAFGNAGTDWEPQRQNNGILRVDPPGGGGEDLILAIESFPLPKQSNEVIELAYANEKRKFAGPVTMDDVTIVYKDFCDQRVAEILWNWRNKVYNPETGAIGRARDYKVDAEVETVGPDNTDSRYWKIMGLWPSNMDPGDMDMTSGENVKINMTFTADKCIFGGTSLPTI